MSISGQVSAVMIAAAARACIQKLQEFPQHSVARYQAQSMAARSRMCTTGVDGSAAACRKWRQREGERLCSAGRAARAQVSATASQGGGIFCHPHALYGRAGGFWCMAEIATVRHS